MGANLYLGNKKKSDYLGAARRLEQLIAKTAYRPTVRRISEFSFLVASHTDVFADYKVIFFGRDMASCQCDARVICIHMLAADLEKDAPINTGASDVHSVGGGMVFFEKDRNDPDRGIRPVVRCGCGSVATVGNRCKLCHTLWLDDMKFDDATIDKANADIFG